MKTPSAQPDISGFLAGLTPRQHEIVAALRRLVRQAVPGAQETLLWKSLSYHRPDFGGRVKGAVCLITPRPDGVHLGFIHGAALSDPGRVLQGAGKVKRFVPVHDVRTIDRNQLADLIQAAAKYDPRTGA